MSKYTNKFMIGALLVVVAMVGGCARYEKAKNGFNKQKVVYHLNDIKTARGVLRNINNHLNAVGRENVDIIAVAHSSGAFTLVDGSADKKGKPFARDIMMLSRKGVKFHLCSNTVRNKKIPKAAIDRNAKMVPSGVAQVINLQQAGYRYIKP